MSVQQPNKATPEELAQARPFLALKVSEVSLVDHAAILRKFLVVKRNAEGNAVELYQELEKALADAGFAYAPAEKSLPDRFVDSLKAVIPWMQQTAEKSGKPEVQEALKTAEWLLSQAQAGKIMKALSPPATPPAAVPQEKSNNEERDPPATEPRQKALTLDGGSATVTLKANGDVEVTKAFGKDKGMSDDKGGKNPKPPEMGEEEKAKKALELAEKARGYLVEASALHPETTKAAIMGMAVDPSAELPKAKSPPSEVRPQGVGTSIAKADDGALAALEATVKKGFAEVGERFEKIEKARTPPTAIPDGGTDGAKPPTQQQVKKSLFHGLF